METAQRFQCFHKLTISLFLSLDTMTAIVLTASASTLSAYLIEESNVYLSRFSPHLQFFPSSSSGNWKSICEGGGFFLREDPFFSGEEGVFNGDQCIFMAPPARMVSQLMEELFAWMKAEQDDVHPLILSSVFHYEFVFIHPFSDGNGRMARLWHTAILSKWKQIFEYIPIESQIEKFQDEYYEAISRCHVAGESTFFIEFMLSQIDKILKNISVQIDEKDEYLPETVCKLLEIMEYDIPYTSSVLMEKLGLKAKEGFRRNYLHPAMEMDLIQMTIPDKPSSRNQRYVRR